MLVAAAERHPSRLGATAAILAGLTFFLTVTYLFAVLGRAGLTLDMFDDHRALLPWVADHVGLYRGLWVLYFISQTLLIPVPWAVHEGLAGRAGASFALAGAVVGTLAIGLALVGLVTISTTSPILAYAFVAATPSEQPQLLLLSGLFADLGKELRLFSEVLLGLWLAQAGALLVRGARRPALGWPIAAIGLYTVAVAAIKIVDPTSPLEDTLGFLLALAYCGLGWELGRAGAARSTDGRAVASTAGTTVR